MPVFTLRRPLLRKALLSSLLALVLLANTWVLLYYQLPGSSYLWSTLHNAGHSLVFLGLTLSLALIIHRLLGARRLTKTSLIAALLSLIFGAVVELIQSRVGREASWSDFALDLLGVAAALCFYRGIYVSRKRARALLFSLCALLLFFSLVKPIKLAVAQQVRQSNFPQIAGFESYWLNQYLKPMYGAKLSVIDASAFWHGKQSQVLKIEMQAAPWPGVMIREVEPDWSGFTKFSFEAFNPTQNPVKIVIRIHDRQHNGRHSDRFNRTISLAPGANLIQLSLSSVKEAPRGREMDMHNIRTIMFYSYQLKAPQVLYLDDIHLSPSVRLMSP